MCIKMMPFLFLCACLLFVHLFAQNLFVKKIKKFEIALMTSFTLLLNQELFLLAVKSAIFVSPKQVKKLLLKISVALNKLKTPFGETP